MPSFCVRLFTTVTKYLIYKLPEGKDVPSSWWRSVRGIRDQLSFACLWWSAPPYVLTLWWPLRLVLPAGDWLEAQHTSHMVVVVASYIQTIIAPVTAQVTCLALARQDILKCTCLPYLSGALSQALGFSGSNAEQPSMQQHSPCRTKNQSWRSRLSSGLSCDPRSFLSWQLALGSLAHVTCYWVHTGGQRSSDTLHLLRSELKLQSQEKSLWRYFS